MISRQKATELPEEKGLPPIASSWPTTAELRAAAAKEPDPMIAINAMRRRLNPNPFHTLRRYLRTPGAKVLIKSS